MSVSPWTAARVEQVADRARAWVLDDALADVVTELGGPRPSLAGLDELRRWSAGRLDTRRGAERRDAPAVASTPDVVDALVRAAEPLGLVRTPPPQRTGYDAVVILAGATTGNLLRTRLAREALDHVEAAVVVALASDRPISASEVADDPASGDDGCEWRNLVRHVGQALGPLEPVTDGSAEGQDGDDRSYRTPDGRAVRLLVAPDQDGRRPTSPLQLRFLRTRMPLPTRRTVLLVTSSIYVPYQFFSGAPEVVADGAEHVEVIGTATELATTGDRSRLGQRLAQEVHAGIDAAATLLAER